MQRFFSARKGDMMRSVALSLVFSTLFIAVSVGAATTISSNISTGGTLSVTGASTLTGLTTMVYASSTTQSLTGNLIVNGYATTTGSNGNIATAGTLSVTGLTTMIYASSTTQSLTGNLIVNGYATTTGSNGNIATAGTLTVVGTSSFTGLATFASASTTAVSCLANCAFGSTATTTISAAGNVTVGGTLTSTAGLSTFASASTTAVSCLANCAFGSTATTSISATGAITVPVAAGTNTFPYASSTATTNSGLASTSSLVVGGNSTNGTLASIVFGVCDLTGASITASTTKVLTCTASSGSPLGTNYKVFVQATSSLANFVTNPADRGAGFIIVSASSTAATVIGVEVSNLTGATNSAYGSLNYWAVR